MNKIITILLLGIISLTSCKSLKKASASDDSFTKSSKKRKTNKNPQFIDGIEVTPGTTVVSKHKTTATKQKLSYETKNNSATNMEGADWLQLKYAVVMDANVERMGNLSLLRKMEEWWGTRYCLGGSTKTCIDCSAFTQLLMREVFNTELPRTAQEQYKMADKIDIDDIREGDLVFFHTGGKSISHVGVYITNGKFANASTSGGVTISDLNDPYWKSKFRGAGRVIKN